MIQAICILVSIKLLVSTNNHSIASFASVASSIALFYIQFYIESTVPRFDFDLMGMFPILMNFDTQYIILIVIVFGFVLVDIGTTYFDNQLMTKMEEIDNYEQLEIQQFIEMEKQRKKRKLTNYTHKGFGFDGAAGHDVLITDSLQHRLQAAFLKNFARGPSIFGIRDMSQSGSNINRSVSSRSDRMSGSVGSRPDAKINNGKMKKRRGRSEFTEQNSKAK